MATDFKQLLLQGTLEAAGMVEVAFSPEHERDRIHFLGSSP